MATPVVFNGVNYSVPAFGDVGYAQGPGNLSAYLIAIASGTLQITGGLFSLTADANFGPNFGLVSIYYKSASANIAQSGVLRLANSDFIAWRNFGNTADLPLAVNASDQLTFNGVVISTAAAGGTVNPGTIGKLALYPATGNTVDDVYVQNSRNIDIAIVTQPTRSSALTYTIPNPGDAVASATFALLQLAQTFTATQTFAAATFTGLITGVDIDLTGSLELKAGATVIFDGATSGAVTMKAPAITTPYTFTLPPNAGTSGYFMQTDGVGVTTWAPAGGVGTFEYVTYTVGTPSGSYSGSTTVFGLPFTYVTDGKHIEVYYNGQQLRFNNDYTETSSTQVTTTSPLLAGQAVWFRTVTGGIVAPATVTLLREDYIVGTPSGTYSGSTTVFNLGNTYTVGGKVLMVTLDGDVQTPGASADYLETNSTTVTFNTALVVGERVSFIWSQTVGVSAGIVNAGTANQLAFYASSTSQVSGTPAITTTGSAVTTTVPTAIKGTTTNDSATAGYVGECIAAITGVLSFPAATGTYGDAATIVLTAGDWDVSITGNVDRNGATITLCIVGIGAIAGNNFSDSTSGNYADRRSTSITDTLWPMTVASYRVSLASTTTYYLKARADFSVATPRLSDMRIAARRVR